MYYFNEFLYEFKKNIYKYRNRKMLVVDKVLLITSIIMIVAALVLFELQQLKFINIKSELYNFLFLLFLASFFVLYIILIIKIKKENKKIDFLKEHRQNVTNKIIALLKDEKYDFYNMDKINWLIECCNQKLDDSNFIRFISILKTLGSVFIPLITLAIGIIVQRFSNEELIYYIAIMIIGFGFLCFIFIALIPIIDIVFRPDKNCLEFLIGELKFIKTISL